MRRIMLAVTILLVLAVLLVNTAYADDPHTGSTKGKPSQSCEDFSASARPGQSITAPGSAFNPNGVSGGVYSDNSQYDVACFQQAQHNP